MARPKRFFKISIRKQYMTLYYKTLAYFLPDPQGHLSLGPILFLPSLPFFSSGFAFGSGSPSPFFFSFFLRSSAFVSRVGGWNTYAAGAVDQIAHQNRSLYITLDAKPTMKNRDAATGAYILKYLFSVFLHSSAFTSRVSARTTSERTHLRCTADARGGGAQS